MNGSLCPYCGAYSKKQCDWEFISDQPRDTAPCVDDDWEAGAVEDAAKRDDAKVEV